MNSTPSLQHLHSNSHGLFFLFNPTFNKCLIEYLLFSMLSEVIKKFDNFWLCGYNFFTISILISVSLFHCVYFFPNILSLSECDGPEIWWPATVYCMCSLWRLYCRCGSGAVVGLWGNMMLVVGPDKDWINFNFDNPVHLVEEEDGLRIIGKYQHEFLHKVPGNKW